MGGGGSPEGPVPASAGDHLSRTGTLPLMTTAGGHPGDLGAGERDGPSTGASAAVAGPAEADPARRPRRHRVLLGIGIVLLVLVVLIAGLSWYVTNRYAGNITRIPGVFSGLDESTRPAPPTPAAGSSDVPITLLLVGVDSGAEPLPGEAVVDPGGANAEVVMLVQVSADRNSAVAVSLPAGSVVPVSPPGTGGNGSPGTGTASIRTAFDTGGPTMLVQTVESLTDVRIDHYVSVDFAGFAEITDALGGVDVRVAEATEVQGVSFTRGLNHLGGPQALVYVRQRSGLPDGELDRVRRQQSYLRAVMVEVARDNLLTDPMQLDDFTLALTGALSVEDTMSDMDVVSLALSLRQLGPGDVTFLTVPIAGTQRGPTGTVVALDQARADQLWSYLDDDSVQDHLAEFDGLPNAPR